MLESRHLVGLFFLLVVIFGVVFTLGYLLGRSQYDSALRAAAGKLPEADPSKAALASKEKGNSENNQTRPPQAGSDWDFYHSAEPKTAEDHLQPPKKAPAAPPTVSKLAGVPPKSAKVAAPAPLSSPTGGPLIPKGAIMVQVAAVKSQSDALALAQALQQKKFPAFVIPPGADNFFRVQVGPYADAKSAAAAQSDLEAKGFKSIIKR